MSPNEWAAILSECGKYRYVLRRKIPYELSMIVYEVPMLFIMLNPSTADAQKNDATIRKIMKFARREGATEITVVNLFAWRETDPNKLSSGIFYGGEPANDFFIRKELKKHKDFKIVIAWGTNATQWAGRENQVLEILKGYDVYHFGHNKDGTPKHPLYLKDTTPLQLYWRKWK